MKKTLLRLGSWTLGGALFIGATSCATTTSPRTEEATEIHSPSMAKQLLGRRPLSLQWISWDNFGEATVREDSTGKYQISGEQRGLGEDGDDYVKIQGSVLRVEDESFVFDGTIQIRVSHINGGDPYLREGKQEFRLYGNRRFWRLVDMDNGYGSVDYVDIYFDMKAAKASPEY